MTKYLVTGAAGFIGFHTAQKLLLARGEDVVGLDNLNAITVSSSSRTGWRCSAASRGSRFEQIDLVDREALEALFAREKFDIVIHLAAQAGVRYSLTNPDAYVDSNLVGFVNMLEGCRHHGVQHLTYASSSSVYGANTVMPFSVHHNVDHPVSLYAATKKANELMAHTYSHLYKLPTTGLRFFTVYGPWGRPDMALFIFTEAILAGKADPGLQRRQDAARLHVRRRHRRRRRSARRTTSPRRIRTGPARTPIRRRASRRTGSTTSATTSRSS